MSKINISRSMKTMKSVITANSPVLLLGATIAGVVTTGVLSAKAGYKARGIVDEAQVEKGPEPLTTQEKVSLTWLCYAAPAITGASTIASATGIHLIHSKRNAMLAGLYAVTAGKLDDYKDEAEKLLGNKKSQQLNDTMAQKAVDGSPLVNNQVIINEGGTELCHDDHTGRYFTSNMNMIDKAINEANAILVDEGELDMNLVYDRLGLEPVPFGDQFGWIKSDTVKKIGIQWGNVTSPDGRPALSISFRPAPKPQLGR